MKNAALFVVLYIWSLSGYAQEAVSEASSAGSRNIGLEVSAGYSMAFGTYTTRDKDIEKSGFATSGWHLQLTFDWMGKKDFGLALQYTFQQNPLSDTASQVVPVGWTNGTLGPGSWSNHYLLAGPVFMKRIKKLHLDAKIMGGVIVSASPNFTTPNPYDTTGMEMDKNLGTGFAWQVSAGIGYAFSSHLALKFNLSLLGGWPVTNKNYGARYLGTRSYKDPETGLIIQEPVYSAAATYEIKKVVTTLNPSLGLIYRF